ncbi:MAG: ABC transporter ATP-binding protein [Gemmatimonadales bacterium]|nr:ABC transporter ATP-binding protein [Gemmatimonadales bacterium]
MIRFTNVSKSFGPKRVLEDVSLEIPVGQTTALLGYSGTGKSVALKLIVGLLEPDGGTVEVNGQNVAELSRDELMALRSTIGFVFQFAALFDSMSVFDNIALGLRQQRVPEANVVARVESSLERVGLAEAAERFPSELSGGMRKRVGIARAIALEPRYILYDEPTTGLDPVTSAVIDDLMVRTKRDLGVTGVMVTHDMRSAFAVADRIAMLYQGRIHAVGTVDEIRRTDDPIVRQFIEGRP